MSECLFATPCPCRHPAKIGIYDNGSVCKYKFYCPATDCYKIRAYDWYASRNEAAKVWNNAVQNVKPSEQKSVYCPCGYPNELVIADDGLGFSYKIHCSLQSCYKIPPKWFPTKDQAETNWNRSVQDYHNSRKAFGDDKHGRCILCNEIIGIANNPVSGVWRRHCKCCRVDSFISEDNADRLAHCLWLNYKA